MLAFEITLNFNTNSLIWMKNTLLFSGILSALSAFGQQRQQTIHFSFDKADLTPISRSMLDSLLLLKIKSIELSGYCDAKGGDAYNDRLSLQRVGSVKDYLLAKGVPLASFTKQDGFGKRQPLNDNSSDELRAMNRRVLVVYETEAMAETKAAPPVVATKPVSLETAMTDTNASKGDPIVLKNLNFVGGRHILLPESIPVLEELLATLRKYPSLQIEILGHICCTADGLDGFDNDLGTRDLSYQRAGAVYKFLIGNGISAPRLSFKGMAGRQPLIFPEATEEDRTRNRRVEIKIVSR